MCTTLHLCTAQLEYLEYLVHYSLPRPVQEVNCLFRTLQTFQVDKTLSLP